MNPRKKLIEVALPLPEINDASAYDKMPGIGPHPKGIYQWWARLPLPTARAVLFASVVDDPEAHPEKWPTEEAQNAERERLHGIIRRMMGKKLHEHPEVYEEARKEMLKHCDGQLPPVFDPFAGGGSIPLEANRLGFEAHAGDLNPVAVLLNKCNLELAPRWVGKPPVNPEDRQRIGRTAAWRGTHGLAADVRHYGRLIHDRARAKIGHLYPKARLPQEYGGGEANVIAWIWARTVASPNPAALGKHVPLISTYWLSSQKGREAWVEPVVDRFAGTYRFEVRTGTPKNRTVIGEGTKTGKGGFRCVLTDSPIPFDHIRAEGQRGRLGAVLLAIVVEGQRGRLYLPANPEHVAASAAAIPSDYPDTDLPEAALGFRIQNYGIRKHWQMFTPRQLQALVMLSDLVRAIGTEVFDDAVAAGLEHLTQPVLEVLPADHRTTQGKERLMDVWPSLISHLEPTKSIHPRKSALRYPAVATEPFTRLNPPTRDAGNDATSPQCLPTAGEVVSLVRVQLGRSLPRPSPGPTNRREGIYRCFQRH